MKKKHKMNPKAKAEAAKRLLSKRLGKKKMVMGNGTANTDREPIQPETNDENKEMMQS